MKHYTKRYKGFLKMCKRQDEKKDITKVTLTPIIMSYTKNGYKPLKKKFFNNKWNGINLKNLKNRENNLNKIEGMYSKITINKDGKYILSIHGKQILKKKRLSQEKKV